MPQVAKMTESYAVQFKNKNDVLASFAAAGIIVVNRDPFKLDSLSFGSPACFDDYRFPFYCCRITMVAVVVAYQDNIRRFIDFSRR